MCSRQKMGLSAGTGKLCIFGHLGLVFIWSCFVSCLLLLLYYVICAPVLTEGTQKMNVVVQIYPWFHSLSYMTTDTKKQRKVEFKPRIKLNQNMNTNEEKHF